MAGDHFCWLSLMGTRWSVTLLFIISECLKYFMNIIVLRVGKRGGRQCEVSLLQHCGCRKVKGETEA